MDKIDVKILAALEQDSRLSLKSLAEDLGIKTSTIYHRIHKLKENNVLEGFTIVVNPVKIGLIIHCLIQIKLSRTIVGKLDKMFLESFAKYLNEDFEELVFSSIGSDESIWCLASFKEEKELGVFEEKMEENQYIEDFTLIRLNDITKGKKIFAFREDLINIDGEGEYFDDLNFEDVEKEEEIKQPEKTEIYF